MLIILTECIIYEHSIAGLKALMRHITGSTIARKKSVQVDFLCDDHGVITAHTCANIIVLPRGVFTSNSYELFKVAMKAVISGIKPFNTA